MSTTYDAWLTTDPRDNEPATTTELEEYYGGNVPEENEQDEDAEYEAYRDRTEPDYFDEERY